jgi:hypothetical protein
VTNPPYGRGLYRFVDHALELTRPVGGMVALLVNIQWQTGAENSKRLRIPAFDASVFLTKRIVWFPGNDGRPAKQPQENHCWLVWDHSRPPGPCSPATVRKALRNPNRRSSVAPPDNSHDPQLGAGRS